MLTPVLAHAGNPPEPHDLWSAWNLHPALVVGIAVAAWLYVRGRRAVPSSRRGRWRALSFASALTAAAVAFVSPLDALSSALASAHMAQHLLLIVVVAPLAVLASPFPTLLRGSPPALRRGAARWRRRLGLHRLDLRKVLAPGVAWMLHVATLWFWHAALPYQAALRNEGVHALEHATLVVTAALFWGGVAGPRARRDASNGTAVLLVFTFALQSVFLAALLTFAEHAWYPAYGRSTPAWGIDPLADQHLAGAIMWVPLGFVYTAVGLRLLLLWIRAGETDEAAPVAGRAEGS